MAFAPKARNFVTQELTHPCARPWWVYVETFIPAFIKLLLLIAFLDLNDVVRDYAVSRSGETPDGKRRRGSHFRKKKSGRLPGTSAQRWAQGGLKTIIVATIPLEILGFTWLLYSGTDKFFYNWQMLLEQSGFCDRSSLEGPFQRSLVEGGVFSSPTGQGFGYDTLVQNRANWANTPLSVTVLAGNVHVMATITLTRNAGSLPDIQLGLVALIGPFIRIFKSDRQTVSSESPTDFILRASFHVPIPLTVGISWVMFGPSSPTGMIGKSGRVIVYETF